MRNTLFPTKRNFEFCIFFSKKKQKKNHFITKVSRAFWNHGDIKQVFFLNSQETHVFSAKVKQFPTCFFSSFVEFSVLTFELAIDSVLFFIEMFSFEFFEFYHHQSRSRSCQENVKIKKKLLSLDLCPSTAWGGWGGGGS